MSDHRVTAGPFTIVLPPNGVAVLYEADLAGVDHQLPGGVGYLDALVQFAGEIIRLKAIMAHHLVNVPTMTDAQIRHMVDRFLSWRLPENFSPDGGISFEPLGNKGTPHEYTHEPSGTNLLDAAQAEAMVRHMIEGMPQ